MQIISRIEAEALCNMCCQCVALRCKQQKVHMLAKRLLTVHNQNPTSFRYAAYTASHTNIGTCGGMQCRFCGDGGVQLVCVRSFVSSQHIWSPHCHDLCSSHKLHN